jgi:hypothetical protein
MAGNVAKAIERRDASVVGEIVSAEFNNQVATARKYPRDAAEALDNLQKLACRSDAVAESCMYTLKRKDKSGQINFITGPSVRFAELLAHAWGNLRAGARIVDEGEKAVVAQGVAYDLQRNTGFSVEVRRGIVTSSGGRFGSDMINVTSNAACSIALRNAIFDCIPQALWSDVYDAVKHKAVGAAAIPERLQKAVQFFVAKGATQEDVLKAMGVKSIADMGRQHLEIFIGLTTALKEGAIDAAKIFTEEGTEQRERLTLVASDDPADPGVPGTPIDRLLNKNGGDPKDAAAKAMGDGGSAPPEEPKGAGGKAKAAAKKAGSAAAKEPSATAAAQSGDKPDDGSATQQPGGEAGLSKEPGPAAEQDGAGQADADREDLDLVGQVEAAWKAAKPTAKSQPIRESRGALTRIAEMSGSEDARKRATTLLNLYDLD